MSSCGAAWLACLAVLAAGCGGDDGDGGGSTSASGGPDGVEASFVARMIQHDELTLQLAQVGGDGARTPDVRRFARQTERRARRELDRLRTRRTPGDASGDLGLSSGERGMDVRPEKLKSSRPVEPAFVNAMLYHEQGALRLAQAAIEQGEDAEVKALANEIAARRARTLRRLARLGRQTG